VCRGQLTGAAGAPSETEDQEVVEGQHRSAVAGVGPASSVGLPDGYVDERLLGAGHQLAAELDEAGREGSIHQGSDARPRPAAFRGVTLGRGDAVAVQPASQVGERRTAVVPAVHLCQERAGAPIGHVLPVLALAVAEHDVSVAGQPMGDAPFTDFAPRIADAIGFKRG
jgi:hypothetical protein